MMTGRQKLYYLLNSLDDLRETTPKSQLIHLHPTFDLNGKIDLMTLDGLLTKLQIEERVIEVKEVSDNGIAFIKILPSFDLYFSKIQNEQEYKEFSNRKPKSQYVKPLSRKSLEKIWSVLQEIEDKRGITPLQDDISIPYVHLSKVRGDEKGAGYAADERRNVLRKLENEEMAIKSVRLPNHLDEFVYLKIGERYFEVFDFYEKAYKEAARSYQEAQQPSKKTASLEEQPQASLKANDYNSFNLYENVLSINGKPIKFKKDARTLALLKLLIKKSKGIYFSEEVKKLEGEISEDKEKLKNTYYEVCRGIDNRLAKIGITDFLQYDFNQAKINPLYKKSSK